MISSIQPAIDPGNKPTFLLDWELTLKCNLDCSYCNDGGPFAGHDTTADHPALEDCIKTIDFMYRYVDLYMSQKPAWTRHVVLNIYGGESLFHPDIETILQQVRLQHDAYKDRWSLTVTCTTNGVIGPRRMALVSDLIDEFTVSYHAESLLKEKQLMRENLLYLKTKNKRLKCVILMHGDQRYWPELLDLIDFCQEHQIRYLPRQLDGDIASNYTSSQITWFKKTWTDSVPTKSKSKQTGLLETRSELNGNQDASLTKVGRACCGGRLMCTNNDLKSPVSYITNNNFQGWKCAVNWFFLFVRQHTKEVFVNKDCRMNFDGTVSPIGHLDQSDSLLEKTRRSFELESIPHMTCAKDHCWCGLCAPKAESGIEFEEIMKKHVLQNVQG